MAGGLIIGVDGGGTHTVAVAAQPDGTVLSSARGAGINYYKIGMEKARENLRQVIKTLTDACGCGYDAMCIGMSALDAEADAATIRAFAGDAFPPDKLDMQSDAYTALIGLTLGEPGMIVICGTGSILMLLDEHGQRHVSGGWGHLLFDAGSAYTLALDGLRAATDAWDGIAPPTALCGEALRDFALPTPRTLIDRLYAPGCTPDRIARFAQPVLAQSEAGDAAASAIVTRHMEHLAEQAAALLREHPAVRRLGLYGGIFLHHASVRAAFTRLLLRKIPDVSVELPAYPPEIGALICCYKKRGTLDGDTLARLKESYEAIQQA